MNNQFSAPFRVPKRKLDSTSPHKPFSAPKFVTQPGPGAPAHPENDLSLEEIESKIAEYQSQSISVDQLPELIEQLHTYNDIKDTAQILIGQLANIRGVTVKSIHKDLGLEKLCEKAGSLIYDFDCSPKHPEIEKTFSYPLELKLQAIDQRVTVIFGERDGIKVGYIITAINGLPISQNGKATLKENSDVDVLSYLECAENYPVSLKFGRPTLKSNEKIILSSMFHSLYAIGAQLSPIQKSGGIQIIDTDTFRLQCYQTTTGTKFVVVCDPNTQGLDALLRKVYELYADYALKNPFYTLDMPIRCDLFDTGLQQLLDRV